MCVHMYARIYTQLAVSGCFDVDVPNILFSSVDV